MRNNFNAFEISPVPPPGPGAIAPELYRGIYGMPMFATLPTSDLKASTEFWTEVLGFFDLFTIPGQLTHLRRWAFQDVLLVPGATQPHIPISSFSFACLAQEIEAIADRCRAFDSACTTGTRSTPWNTIELEIITPENARIIFTAARELDPAGEEATYLRDAGFDVPEASPAASQNTEG
ncbi:VOC family protein [Humidisolicoccus flavus]|uniref:VOC family protein n=1 Tax=Humidisolicoccus flavus TaxID=3111414 RepID=UPI0032436CF5